jgi:hypothetical protein
VNVLVDTSVWSLALRRAARDLSAAEKLVVTEVVELIHEDRARLIGLVRQELLSGIKSKQQFAKLREILEAFPDEPAGSSDYEQAALFSNDCRAKGFSVSVSDMLICSIAHSRGWAIFSTDPDFQRYARILPITVHALRK